MDILLYGNQRAQRVSLGWTHQKFYF